MKQSHHLHRRLLATQLATGLLILLLAACQTGTDRPRPTAAAPTATKQPNTPTPKPTVTKSAKPEPVIAAGSVQYASVTAIRVDLPETWKMERLDGAALVERLRDPSPEHDTVLDQVKAAAGPETEVLWAISGENRANGSIPSQLLVAMLPRHGLSLSAYVSAVAAVLTENGGISVERAGIVYDIREDGQPVAVVQYQIDAANGDTDTGGYQIAQFDDDADNLIVLTFTAAAPELSAQIDMFNGIAASVGVKEIDDK